MKDFENYSKDLLKLNPTLRFIFGLRDKETLSKIERNLDESYLNSLKLIANKYRNTKDLELLNQIKTIDFYLNNKLYLLLFESYNNFIIDFTYSTNKIYPENEIFKKARQLDFNKHILDVIAKAKESLQYKITYPKIIIKKFLNQINSYNTQNNRNKFNDGNIQFWIPSYTTINLTNADIDKSNNLTSIRDVFTIIIFPKIFNYSLILIDIMTQLLNKQTDKIMIDSINFFIKYVSTYLVLYINVITGQSDSDVLLTLQKVESQVMDLYNLIINA